MWRRVGAVVIRLVAVRSFLNSCWLAFYRRSLFFAVMNLVYFGSIPVGVFWAQFQTPLPPAAEQLPLEVPWIFSLGGMGFAGLFLFVFIWNLLVSAFLVVTLVGLVFFGFSMATLVMRAWIWATLVAQMSTQQFLTVLPTLVLEGEGYVFASVAGVVLGLSWLKPSFVFKGEALSRSEALRKALQEAAYLFVWVVLLLFVAALVEATTIMYLA